MGFPWGSHAEMQSTDWMSLYLTVDSVNKTKLAGLQFWRRLTTTQGGRRRVLPTGSPTV